MSQYTYPYPVFPDISPDYKLCRGSYLYNSTDDSYYLDFFNNFSANPIAYDSTVFNSLTSYYSISRLASCAYSYSIIEDFCWHLFNLDPVQSSYSVFVPSETGALAVSNAIKIAALNLKEIGLNPKLVVLKNSYHGINGVAACATQSASPYINRFIYDSFSPFPIFQLTSDNLDYLQSNAKSLIILVEPIRSTYGDLVISPDELEMIKSIASSGATLIIDEIQSGFYSTGFLWSFQLFDLDPDIVVFGKKFQVCGFQAKPKFSRFLEPSRPKYFSVTFDFSFADMHKSILLMKHFSALGRSRIANLVSGIESSFISLFDMIKTSNHSTTYGLLSCIHFPSSVVRDHFFHALINNKVLANKTGEKSLRFRPTIDTNSEELNFFASVLSNINI